MKKLILILLSVPFIANSQVQEYSTQKEVHTKNKGTVVSAHPLASEVGAKMLRMGGNAFDAATATQLALAVVYPQAGNLGGGGFLVGSTSTGEKIAIDFREVAPQKATKDMYLDAKGKANTEWSQFGRLAVGVPGSVAGFFATLPYGKLSMETLIQPAIDLAEKGFAITEKEAQLLNAHQEKFLLQNKTPIAFVKDTPWKMGDLLVQKELAHTLRKIQKEGKKGFYEGEIAEKIVKEMTKGKGVISLEDLKNYQPVLRKPLEFSYKGHQIVTMPLPSSGGILLAQMLKFSALQNLEKYPFQSPEAVQIMVEAERRAFADRAEYMGDPAFVKDPTQKLTSDAYILSRWKNFSFEKATPSASVGTIVPIDKESTETTHLSVIDKYGNAVAVTTTLNGLYGSKVVVAGAGFLLNNEMDDFSIKPGVPNMFGAVGGEANAIAPKKRMLSSMTPTLVLKENRPFMIVGTPGGTTIPTSVFQSIVNVIDFKLNPNLAVNLPKFHHQWLPEEILIEPLFPPHTKKILQSKNYKLTEVSQLGRTEMIVIDPNSTIHAVADGRGDDAVAIE